MKVYVKLYKSGDSMAVETNAATEEEFHSKFSEKLSDVIESGQFKGDLDFQFGFWLKNYVDICCKLRGYKSDVIERRIITAGFVDPDQSTEVTSP